ncbi:MAG: amidase [Candidatus Schekmanbacteria bacterium]|nr:amidase [Candidatus Schekmanbacteria bacterium]
MSICHTYSPQSALGLASAIRARAQSCEALTAACLAEVARSNSEVNAFVQVFDRRARRQAQTLDRILQRGDGQELPIFFGVPNGIKDIDFMAGTFTCAGSRAFRYFWSPFDSAVTKRVRAGGFVLLGKLATSEFAIMPITETDIHAPCRNPWNLEHTPGGSSGGSAAAVASGMLPMAHASDGAGSIRIPASFCHLYGLKPSRSAMPNYYYPADMFGLSSVNAVSHGVEDSAAMLDVMAGRSYDPRRPPEDSYLAACQRPPGNLRINFTVESPLVTATPPVADAVRRVARLLAQMGHTVEEADTLRAELGDFLPLWMRMAANVPVISEALLQPPTRWLREHGRTYSRAEAKRYGAELQRKVLAWFGAADVWLTPTVAVAPPRIGAWRGLSGEEAFMSIVPLGAFTAIFNVSGQPAASIPAGVGERNLPFGVQIVGRPGADALVLALSRTLEQAMPWREQSAARCAPAAALG